MSCGAQGTLQSARQGPPGVPPGWMREQPAGGHVEKRACWCVCMYMCVCLMRVCVCVCLRLCVFGVCAYVVYVSGDGCQMCHKVDARLACRQACCVQCTYLTCKVCLILCECQVQYNSLYIFVLQVICGGLRQVSLCGP